MLDATNTNPGGSAGTNPGSTGGAAGPTDSAKRTRTVKSPEEKIREAEQRAAAERQKIDEKLAKEKAKLLKDAIPLSQRKTSAFELLEKLRAQVRSAPERADLSDAEADQQIQSAIDATFKVTDPVGA